MGLRAKVIALLICSLIAPLGCGPRPIDREPSPTRADGRRIEALEAGVHKRVNAHRQSKGLPPLEFSERLAAIARRHSQNMATRRAAFGHAGFDGRTREIATAIGYRAIAENVGFNEEPLEKTGSAAVSGWLQSAGHRKNIEGRFDLSGVGVARDSSGRSYYTQIFVEAR